ncbi:MAG: heavy metal-binding domain-containing protein, partial [Hyphomicrobiales bacterium]
NMRELFAEAGLESRDILLWNVCPWYNGIRKTTSNEVMDGLEALSELLDLLPDLETVVLVGNHAHTAEGMLSSKGMKVIKTAHPSPLVRNINPAMYAAIAPAWAEASRLQKRTGEEKIAKQCPRCNAKLPMFHLMELCDDCTYELQDEHKRQDEEERAKREAVAQAKIDNAKRVLVTTETFSPDLKIEERLGIVTAEVAEGMNAFKDFAADFTGVVGGRSGVTQKTLRNIRETVIAELKLEASLLGANAVIAVDLDYQEFGTTGRFLFVVASGTAVIVSPQ